MDATAIADEAMHASDATPVVCKSPLVFATQGKGHGDETRILELLREFIYDAYAFDRGSKLNSCIDLLRTIRRNRPPLVVMEGTGIGGGLAVMLGRILFGVPYVVSSGDAISPFLAARMPLAKPIFAMYERMLCRWCAGFIGWTPYLAGRALTFGAPRAMTAAGWADFGRDIDSTAREHIRSRLGIAADDIVFGIVGSLDWNDRVGYCYGHELVRAIAAIGRPNVKVLIIGDGSGKSHLERSAGSLLGKNVIMTGRIAKAEVSRYLAAMDIGSLPQSVDGVGSFRYTIKLSEYLAAALPIVTGQIPLAYDLDGGWLWRLPGGAPWDEKYIRELSALMETITPAQIAAKRRALPATEPIFDREQQVKRVTSFINEILECAA
jgi:glycosyltransferase involved in cell wall biosynthesis